MGFPLLAARAALAGGPFLLAPGPLVNFGGEAVRFWGAPSLPPPPPPLPCPCPLIPGESAWPDHSQKGAASTLDLRMASPKVRPSRRIHSAQSSLVLSSAVRSCARVGCWPAVGKARFST
eukprot:11206021-Lingulodinium_polyedra.AAC.1